MSKTNQLLKNFVSSIYSTKQILPLRHTPTWLVSILMLATVMMSCFPFYQARIQVFPSQLQAQFTGVDQVFQTLANQAPACRISDDARFSCDQPLIDQTINQYLVTTTRPTDPKVNYVYFGADGAAINHIIDGQSYQVAGPYLEPLDFKTLAANQPTNSTPEKYYQLVAEQFIFNLFTTQSIQTLMSITFIQTLQTIFFILIFAASLLLTNRFRTTDKLNYLACLKLETFLAFGPALLMAIASLILPEISGLAGYGFTIIFTIRHLLFYYQRMPKRATPKTYNN